QGRLRRGGPEACGRRGLRPFGRVVGEDDENDAHPYRPAGSVRRWHSVLSCALRPTPGAGLPVLSSGDEPRRSTRGTGGIGPACRTLGHTLACEPARTLVRRRLHPGAHAAGSRSRGTRKRAEHISTAAGAHRRNPAYPVWRGAHWPGADCVALLGPPRTSEARSVRLVALGARWHGLRGQLVGVCQPNPGCPPRTDRGPIAGGGTRGARHALLCARAGDTI